MNTQTFLFAWSDFIGKDNKLTYFAVAQDFSIYSSSDWESFYSHTGKHCDKRRKLYCEGSLAANPDTDIFEHADFKYPFIMSENAIQPLTKRKEINLFEVERDTEAEYFAAIDAWSERDRY